MPQLLSGQIPRMSERRQLEYTWGRRIAHVMLDYPLGKETEHGTVGGYLIENDDGGNPCVKVVDRRGGMLRLMALILDDGNYMTTCEPLPDQPTVPKRTKHRPNASSLATAGAGHPKP